MKQEYNLLYNSLYGTQRLVIGSDGNLKDALKVQVVNREALYTALLKNYTKTTRWRNKLKEFHKWAFFWLVMLTGFVVVRLISEILYRVLLMNNDDFIKSVPIIIAAFVSLISTIIGIPVTITKFLFNTKEDDNITHTIHHTQNHDTKEVGFLLNDSEKRSNDKKTKRTPDQTIINNKTIPTNNTQKNNDQNNYKPTDTYEEIQSDEKIEYDEAEPELSTP